MSSRVSRTHRPSVLIVGGLAVLSRLSNPHRTTLDLDLVDQLHGDLPQLGVLRTTEGAEPVEPAAVLGPTAAITITCSATS
ncbi:hypothetical protein [Rhodococcus koreensis]|uniref:hypothetical protein n=1 Tax=Rhodococcus koreensis TaxID=99653 RepID=UPI00367322F0